MVFSMGNEATPNRLRAPSDAGSMIWMPPAKPISPWLNSRRSCDLRGSNTVEHVELVKLS